MRALLLVLALAAAAPAPSAEALAAFKAAPVGQRLAALGHEPLLALPIGGDEVAVVVYAPFQGALSRWDDESRVVLYHRATPDWERIQFVSKAGEGVSGKLALLRAMDVDGDGVLDLVAIGGPHGVVGKATIIVYRRRGPGEKLDMLFRRRHAASAVRLGADHVLTYTYETPRRERRFERFRIEDGVFVSLDGDARPMVMD